MLTIFFNWQWFRQLTLYSINIIILIRVKVHAFYAEITSYFYYWYFINFRTKQASYTENKFRCL